MTSFDESLHFLYSLQFFGIKLGLDNIRRLCAFAGNPERAFRSIHVAGTNGKGSVCAIVQAILQKAGYSVGLYTSPHIHHFTERIQINRQRISEPDLVRLTEFFRREINRLNCTFFEATTAMAFKYFAESGVDVGVVETGLGGRLDATNVVQPEVSLITSIGLDHTEHLGNDVRSIAREKGGIIKAGVPVIVGWVDPDSRNVIDEIGRTLNTAVHFLEDQASITVHETRPTGSQFDFTFGGSSWLELFTPLPGRHQILNAAIAVAALHRSSFEIEDEAIRDGLASVSWRGRLQKIADSPVVYVDAAHNSSALKTLALALREWFAPERMHLVIGMLRDKDYAESAGVLEPHFATVTTVTPNSHRAVPAEELAARFGSKAHPAPAVREALTDLRKRLKSTDVIVVTGSHFVLSELEFPDR